MISDAKLGNSNEHDSMTPFFSVDLYIWVYYTFLQMIKIRDFRYVDFFLRHVLKMSIFFGEYP